MQDETTVARQLIASQGRNAVLQANETAVSLKAMGDVEGAARWRRIRDVILEISTDKAASR